VSSLRESSTTIYGGFGVPGGLLNSQRRLYSKIASKKGKKSEKDVLLEDREPQTEVLLEVRGEHVVGEGEIEKLDVKKTKKKKKVKELPENGDAVRMDDGIANVHSEDAPDAELLTKLKKEKKKKTKNNNLKEEELETDSGMVLNGASTAEDIQEPTLQSEAKGKKKLKNKSKRSESENELPESDPESASGKFLLPF